MDERRLRIHLNKKHTDELVTESASNESVDATESLRAKLARAKSNVPVLRRIPKGARYAVADKLCAVVKHCIDRNSLEAWTQLFLFSYIVLTSDKDKRKTLTTKIKNNVSSFNLTIKERKKNSPASLSQIIQAKVDDFDIRGAVRVLSSADTQAPHNAATVEALKEKHPPESLDLVYPEPPDAQIPVLTVQEDNVLSAINSFPSGSSGGTDGFRPQFLKDLTSVSAGEAGKRVLTALTQLCNFMLLG